MINDGEGDVDSEGNPITYVLLDEFTDIINTKQDILTNDNAGTGIEITTDSEGNTIIYNTNVSAEWGNIQGDIDDQLDLIQRLSGKQDELIPGPNIDISNNSEGSPVISVVGLSEVALSGDYADITNKPTTLAGYGITDTYTKTETDALLEEKQDVLTAGNGISIVNGAVSIEDGVILNCGTSSTVV